MDDREWTAEWVGPWAKVSEEGCTTPYPERLELMEKGVFDAPGGPEAGAYFHSGDYRVEENPLRLVLQAANDAMVTHQVVEKTRDLLVLSRDGCRVRYRRAGPD